MREETTKYHGKKYQTRKHDNSSATDDTSSRRS